LDLLIKISVTPFAESVVDPSAIELLKYPTLIMFPDVSTAKSNDSSGPVDPEKRYQKGWLCDDRQRRKVMNKVEKNFIN
jgi:hypothetical protein